MRLFIAVLIAFAALALTVTPAFATSTGSPGQPNQSCLSSTAPSEPGQAANAPGSAFNESGPGTAGTVYAGQQPQNSNNPNSVSQYDVACFQVSQPH
jgi:hypothetical protein